MINPLEYKKHVCPLWYAINHKSETFRIRTADWCIYMGETQFTNCGWFKNKNRCWENYDAELELLEEFKGE